MGVLRWCVFFKLWYIAVREINSDRGVRLLLVVVVVVVVLVLLVVL